MSSKAATKKARAAMPEYHDGEEVDVYCCNKEDDTFQAVDSYGSISTPRVGLSRGWIRAKIVGDQRPPPGHADYYDDGRICIQYQHQKWVDRNGEVLDASNPRHLRERVIPARIRKARGADRGAASPVGSPGYSLSVLIVRWASESCPTVANGDGGWGETGSVTSDRYIETWLQALDVAFPQDHQIVTAFVQSSDDMTRLAGQAHLIRRLLEGRHVCAFYFVWPVQFRDESHGLGRGDDGYPGYCEQQATLSALRSLESAGIATRFPHPSHQYRTFLRHALPCAADSRPP
jgi:hypothetical protein